MRALAQPSHNFSNPLLSLSAVSRASDSNGVNHTVVASFVFALHLIHVNVLVGNMIEITELEEGQQLAQSLVFAV